jgi:hypothetical protein
MHFRHHSAILAIKLNTSTHIMMTNNTLIIVEVPRYGSTRAEIVNQMRVL